jgi:hypothetical protein
VLPEPAWLGQTWRSLTSGLGIYPAFPDFLTLRGDCTWVDDLESLHEAIPEYPEWQRQVGRYIKYSL